MQKGQILLILLLVMTVGLAIGLSVIQRSLTDVSTSSKLEQSTRALSAAEAGIERALEPNQPSSFQIPLTENNSNASVSNSGLLPAPNSPLEYPPLSKEEVAQFWLADPNPAQNLPKYYSQDTLDIYWGTPGLSDSDKAALELSVIYKDNSANYGKKQYFFDPVTARRSNNNFADPSLSGNCNGSNNFTGSNTTYACRVTISGLSSLVGASGELIMARARFLYTNVTQPLALSPTGGVCGNNSCSLPPQASVYTSTGSAGDAQRRVQLFRMDQVIPPYLDYAIFSAGDIVK